MQIPIIEWAAGDFAENAIMFGFCGSDTGVRMSALRADIDV